MSHSSLFILSNFLLVVLIVGSASAATIVVDFRDVTSVACGAPWVQDGCPVEVVTTTADDCGGAGNCNTGVWVSGITLAPARMVMDLSGIQNLETAMVFATEFDDNLTIHAWLLDGDGATIAEVNSYQMSSNHLQLDAGGQVAASLAVSGCECDLVEINLIGTDLTSATTSTWGAVKALY